MFNSTTPSPERLVRKSSAGATSIRACMPICMHNSSHSMTMTQFVHIPSSNSQYLWHALCLWHNQSIQSLSKFKQWCWFLCRLVWLDRLSICMPNSHITLSWSWPFDALHYKYMHHHQGKGENSGATTKYKWERTCVKRGVYVSVILFLVQYTCCLHLNNDVYILTKTQTQC